MSVDLGDSFFIPVVVVLIHSTWVKSKKCEALHGGAPGDFQEVFVGSPKTNSIIHTLFGPAQRSRLLQPTIFIHVLVSVAIIWVCYRDNAPKSKHQHMTQTG